MMIDEHPHKKKTLKFPLRDSHQKITKKNCYSEHHILEVNQKSFKMTPYEDIRPGDGVSAITVHITITNY